VVALPWRSGRRAIRGLGPSRTGSAVGKAVGRRRRARPGGWGCSGRRGTTGFRQGPVRHRPI